MIVYNITVKPDPQIAEDWLSWCTQEFIPGMLNTGCFGNTRVLQMLEVDNSDGPTYTIQFNAESKALYNLYREKHADYILEKAQEIWENRFVSFHSVMQVINQCE